ncbi:galactonate dehydratase [Sinomonas terrae]|uniref:Galactonate dehydratase n=1 Tax=Sinomonas terrae TaxID=2908838 RepID=A0ABS9U5X6_9MICC|nr:galactonate dehydratase [Sinomonas terrae]MCH6472104.1 galactonate dehydratase [Sinomonas terrae]
MTAITGVETVVVNASLRNWVFVKVTTDEPGLIGWGEATLEWKARAVVGAVADLAELVVGEDPERIEYLWQLMYRGQFFQGGAVTMSALSGIDQALWDIAGKKRGVPAWQLLGGRVRDTVTMYDHLGGGDSSIVYGAATQEGFAESAIHSIDEGFTALKILAVPMGAGLATGSQIRAASEVMGAVREAVGPDIQIMVDLHGRTTAAAALQYGRALAEYDPWFFEEPCQPGNPATMASIARALPFPVATGERLTEIQQFRDHLAVGACAVLQPDVCHVGGPTALKKIAAIAESWHVPLAPHNPLGPIATMVNQHMGFSTPNFLIQEVMRGDVPWRDEVVSGTLPIVRGKVTIPDKPGWGLDVDETAAARHPYEPEPVVEIGAEDGFLNDW